MPATQWAKMNLPESELRRIKSNAAMEGLTMVQYIAGLVKKDEKARAAVQSTPGTTTVRRQSECQP